MQRGLELLREETEARDAEVAALRELLEERREGRFEGMEAGRERTVRMLDRKRAAHGLSG